MRVRWLVILVTLIGLSLQPLAQTLAGPSGPRRLTIAYGAIPTTADPAYDTNALAMDAYDMVFDTLVVFRDGKLKPSVAESWKVLSDTEWEFRLRRDVKFQNGEPLTAAAVKFSLERMLNPANRVPWMAQLGPISRIDAVDDYTVRIRTAEPVGTLAANLLIAYLVPPKYFQDVGRERFAREPVGSGPFKFKEMNPLTHFTVTAYPESWRWAGKRPGLDEVTWRKIPEDATRVAAFRAREVDVVEAVPPEQASRLRAAGATVVSQPIAQTLSINLRSTWDTPLKLKKVRQALNYAVDKESIIKNILLGHATISEGQLIGPDGFGYNPNLKAYPYDAQRARQLLSEAGYPNGFEMTFHGSQGRYPKDKEVAEVIIAQLAQVGVRARLEYLENAVFSQMSVAGTIGPLNIYGWQYMPAMDISQPIPFFMCKTPRKNFCDSTLDEAVNSMLNEMDAVRRARRAQILSGIMRDTAPIIFLWQFHSVYGIQPYVKGYVPSSARRVDLTNVTVER
jgi:peptide/nickel transport system substrate-binding protein